MVMDEEKEIIQDCYDQLIDINEKLCDVPEAKKINDRLDRTIRMLGEMLEDDEDNWD